MKILSTLDTTLYRHFAKLKNASMFNNILIKAVKQELLKVKLV